MLQCNPRIYIYIFLQVKTFYISCRKRFCTELLSYFERKLKVNGKLSAFSANKLNCLKKRSRNIF